MCRRPMMFFLLLIFSTPSSSTLFVEGGEGSDIVVKVPFAKNTDKKVVFDEPVALGVTSSFQKVIRTQNIGNTLYLTAINKTDRRFRLVAKGRESKKTYVLLVYVTDDQGDAEDIRIIPHGAKVSVQGGGGFSEEITPIHLTRFVSQNLYAPDYAIEPLLGARRTVISLPERIDFIHEGDGLEVSPLVAYEGGKWTLTALKVVNKSSINNYSLDRKGLMKFYPRLKAYGVVAQHKYLGVDKNDNHSVVYVITEGPLAENIKVGW